MDRDLISPAVVTALGGGFLAAAQRLPATPGQDYGASFLPSLVAALMTACGVVLLARTLAQRRRGPRQVSERPAAGHAFGALLVVAVLGGYVVLAEHLGFHLTATLGVGLLITIFTRRPLRAFVIAALTVAVVHALFYGLFKVPLPWGLLQGLAW